MLELMDINNAVAFRLSGKVTNDDMSVVLAATKQKIALYSDIVVFEKNRFIRWCWGSRYC